MPHQPVIYFACSIRGGRAEATCYSELVEMIRKYADVVSEHFASSSLTQAGTPAPEPEIWKTDLDMIRNAHAVIAEVSVPSLGVGYEIAKAEEWSKPVLCLFRVDGMRTLSAMIRGSANLKVVDYSSIADTESAVELFVRNLDLAGIAVAAA